MSERHIVIVSGEEEWSGVYADGVLVFEYSSLDGRVVEALAAAFGATCESWQVKQRWMNDRGTLPGAIKHIPKSAIVRVTR